MKNPEVRSTMSKWRQVVIRCRDSLQDRFLDFQSSILVTLMKQSECFDAVPALNILAVGVQSDKRNDSLQHIFAQLASNKHHVVTKSKGVENAGKLANSNALLASFDLNAFDYVILCDDDVALDRRAMDVLIGVMSAANLDIAAPAHRWKSFYNHEITRRRNWSIYRLTNFVEVGPVVAFSRKTFARVFPMPELEFGWGLDLLWSKLAKQNGWRQAIVDATSLNHLAPAGTAYKLRGAYDEMEMFKREQGVELSFKDIRTLATVRTLSTPHDRRRPSAHKA